MVSLFFGGNPCIDSIVQAANLLINNSQIEKRLNMGRIFGYGGFKEFYGFLRLILYE